ncbi:hypothetical protein OC842_004417 [Tilletia horrida]|uniref:Uncharacterized protein n=1 Tax=Tilletia horrida TaxID=155126 RepID=A0AAN6G9T9_9BASI|nr:hypothetical protein OC842_004417 [Tilletia horrida]
MAPSKSGRFKDQLTPSTLKHHQVLTVAAAGHDPKQTGPAAPDQGHLLAQFSKIFRDSTLAAAAQITASMLDVDESDIKSARASKGSVKAITSASEPQESSNERKRKSKVALRRREVRDMVILRQMAADALRARADPDSAASEMSPTGSSPRLSLLATPPPSHGSPELSPSMHSHTTLVLAKLLDIMDQEVNQQA